VGRTGGKIFSDIAKNKSWDLRAEDITSSHIGDDVTDSPHRLVIKLRGRGLKSARSETKAPKVRGDKKPKFQRQSVPG